MHCSFCTTRKFPLVILMSVLLYENGKSSDIAPTEGELLEMIYSQRTSLVKMDLRTPSKTSVLVDDLKNAVAIDYHFQKDLVLWTDVVDKGIYSANIDSKGKKKTITKHRVVTPDGLAVDWIHENIYWTDTGTNTISVASLDGEMRKLLFEADLDEPRAIVVNPHEGWMFWTDWGKSPKIERSGMDGTHRSTVVSSQISMPNGLTIDYETRRLFWIDVLGHVLRSSDYDGSNVKKIRFSVTIIGHPFALDVFQDWLYWTDWRSHGIYKAHKVNGSMAQMISSSDSLFPMGLKVYHSSKQPKDPATVKLKPVHSYTIFERTTTEAITTTSVIESPSQSKLQSNSINKILQEIHENVYYYGRLVGITFGTLVVLIIALSLVGFCFYKPSAQRHISRLNFANPVFGKQTEDQA